MPLCKMCLEQKKLIEAHIIPYGFFRYIKDSPGDILQARSTNSPYKRRCPKGIYDRILCNDCEQIFQIYDEYAQKLLLPDFDPENYIADPNGNKIVYVFKEFNYTSLKLFFLSLLWRAAVSTRPEFKRVEVGPFASILKRMIQRHDPGTDADFSVILTRFDDDMGKQILINPRKIRLYGLDFYLFYLGGYKVYVKPDTRPLPAVRSRSNWLISPNCPLYIGIHKDFMDSPKELSLVAKAIKNTKSK